MYIAKHQILPARGTGGEPIALRPMPRPGTIDDLQERGKGILHGLCQRIDWALRLWVAADGATAAETANTAVTLAMQQQIGIPYAAVPARVMDTMVRILAADRQWTFDASQFMKDAELTVTNMLTSHPVTISCPSTSSYVVCGRVSLRRSASCSAKACSGRTMRVCGKRWNFKDSPSSR